MRPPGGDPDAEGEGDEVLGVEDGYAGPECKPNQRAADAPERVQDVRAPRAVAAPEDLRDDADPGGDDGRKPDIRRVRESVERAGIQRARQAEEAVDRKRCEHLAGERRQHHHLYARHRECCESDDRETEERGQPRAVGDNTARQQQPDPSLRDRPRGRCEM